ncbi:MAG: flagellar hook-associated protein FlgL [Erysipelotrichaceae bacterium]|nr:flagellar hook-associated protein FlgL [Erysipelotrichaceae bacterium]
MRVTNRMMGTQFLIHLRKNMTLMQKTQNQLATGKEISKPSDDPVRVVRAMTADTSLQKNAQFRRNIEDSYGWTETTDGALAGMTDTLNRLRELAIAGANGTLGDSEFKALYAEVRQLVEGLAQTGNANYDGRYIFGGTQTTQPPFKVDETTGMLLYQGDQGSLEREVLPGVTMKVNVNGSAILGSNDPADEKNLAVTLNRLMAGLSDPASSDRSKLGGELLRRLDGHIDTVLSLRTSSGAVSNRLEAMKQLNASETLSLTELLSKTEDIDFAEKVMQFSMLENVYKASLSTGAKILQPTLLDYL